MGDIHLHDFAVFIPHVLDNLKNGFFHTGIQIIRID